MRTVIAELDALKASIEALEEATTDAEATLPVLGCACPDLPVIREQVQKALETLGHVRTAIEALTAPEYTTELSTLLHRLNNHFTGAASLAALAREDVREAHGKHHAGVLLLDRIDQRTRVAARLTKSIATTLKGG